jgi:hypothetical protein
MKSYNGGGNEVWGEDENSGHAISRQVMKESHYSIGQKPIHKISGLSRWAYRTNKTCTNGHTISCSSLSFTTRIPESQRDNMLYSSFYFPQYVFLFVDYLTTFREAGLYSHETKNTGHGSCGACKQELLRWRGRAVIYQTDQIDCIASAGRMTDECWTAKDLEGNSRVLIEVL